MKTCKKCDETKPLSEFHKASTCDLCKRKDKLKIDYGITLDQYSELLTSQNWWCAICLRDFEVFDRRLAVDHDHVTGEIRGLLCDTCNYRVIGNRRDASIFYQVAEYLEGVSDDSRQLLSVFIHGCGNPGLYRRAAAYLEGPFTGWFVPPEGAPEEETETEQWIFPPWV